MKILVANDLKMKFGGGAEKVIFDIKKLFIEKGHHVSIIGKDSFKQNVVSLFSRIFSIKYYFLTKRLIEETSIDVVHVHNFSRMISPSPIIAAKKLNRKVILTIHDFHMYCPKTWGIFQDNKVCTKGYNLFCPFYNCYTFKKGPIYLPYHFLKWLKVGLHRRVIKKYVDHYICPSRQLKEFMHSTLGIPNNKISYLPNFIEINKEEKINFDNMNPKQFLFVGRISKEKGIDLAVKAIHYLVSERDLRDIRLKIIGDGLELNRLKSMVKKLKMNKNITFYGRIDNDELYRYYQESVAVLMPSVWLENNPIVALEAMKNKKPIIASKVGGYPDLIEHDRSGYLFEMHSIKQMSKYIQNLYDNKEKSMAMGEYGYQKLKREFSREKYYQSLLNLYNGKNILENL